MHPLQHLHPPPPSPPRKKSCMKPDVCSPYTIQSCSHIPHLHTAPQDDRPVKGRVSRSCPPTVHGAGEAEEKAAEVQILLSTSFLHQLHYSTLNTEVQCYLYNLVSVSNGKTILSTPVSSTIIASTVYYQESISGLLSCACGSGCIQICALTTNDYYSCHPTLDACRSRNTGESISSLKKDRFFLSFSMHSVILPTEQG